MLDPAVDADRLRANPARTRAGKAPYVPRARRPKVHRYLSAEELGLLADAAGSHGTMLLLAGYTGLRWGEISALTVSSYNPLSGRLSVERAYSNVGGVIVLGDTKTHERRDVAVPSFLRVELVALGAGKNQGDLLFAAGNGAPLDSRNFSQRVLTPAWREASIPRLTFHDLRHTAASLAIASGTPDSSTVTSTK
jgi:integrase